MGITVNALCPGGIETDIMKEHGPVAAPCRWASRTRACSTRSREESAIKRLNEVEDVALVAVLLASDAGAGITGSLISIDGGTSPY